MAQLGLQKAALGPQNEHFTNDILHFLAFALFGLLDLWAAGNVAALGTALLGAALAALFAFASIDIFLKLTRRLSFLPFVLYRIGLGVVILLVM